MKFTVSQEVFKSALDTGALAAVSDTAQLDDETVSLLVRSVSISVDKELVVESTEKAIFGDFYLARKYAQAYKNNKPDKILETWEVV